MNVLVFLPIDTIVKTWARQFEADGHRVETTFTFSTFLKRVRQADWTLVNVSKNDSPRFVWKLLLSLLWARLFRRRVALFISIDPVDLCDRPILRAVLWTINRVAFHCATLVFLLAAREHVVRRYHLARDRVIPVYNCPDRATFGAVGQVGDLSQEPPAARQAGKMPRSAERAIGRPIDNLSHPLTFLYHGELLWWHGLERFLPLYVEIRKHRPARLIVTGNFYPSVFRVFGLAASRREAGVKRQLADLLARTDVEYRGRVPLEELRRLMAEADFHVSLLNDQELLARTELRTGLLEAMAAGMVCLHAPTPALPADIFRDGENILLIDPNDPAASAAKILALADSPDRLESIRRQAVETIARHFDMNEQYAKAVAAMTKVA